jgi:pre-rRNA-processing protein TSR4
MSGTGGGEGMEKLFESSMDTTFQKFADRLAQNPEQVLRYEFGASPLLYSSSDAVGKKLGHETGAMPRCPNCGNDRRFEVQMTPHAITVLEVEELGLEGMEWGTVVVGACGSDCVPVGVEDGGVGYVEEWVGVQWEEVGK